MHRNGQGDSEPSRSLQHGRRKAGEQEWQRKLDLLANIRINQVKGFARCRDISDAGFELEIFLPMDAGQEIEKEHNNANRAGTTSVIAKNSFTRMQARHPV